MYYGEYMAERELTISEIKNLLFQVKGIKQKNDAIIETTGGNYNIFRVLGIGHDELIFSKMIGNLLNPKACHGFSESFLKTFIESLPLDDLPNDFEYTKAKIELEKHIGARNDKLEQGGRIDIFIKIPTTSKKNFAFIIENKIYAEDQNKQLLRYKKFAQEKFGENYYILYLTLGGRNPSEESVGKNCLEDDTKAFWTNISYKENIKEWIENCTMQATKFPLLRETLQSFSNQINRITGQDFTKMNESEILTLLTENLSETGIVYNWAEKAIVNAVKQNFMKFYESIKQKYDFADNKFIFDKVSDIYPSRGYKEFGFYFWKSSWNKLRIGFSFESSNLQKFKFGIYIPHKEKVSVLTEEDEALLRKYAMPEINKEFSKSDFTPYWIARIYAASPWDNWTTNNIKNSDNKELQNYLTECTDKLMLAMKILEDNFSKLI